MKKKFHDKPWNSKKNNYWRQFGIIMLIVCSFLVGVLIMKA
jgi:hypothetical protein